MSRKEFIHAFGFALTVLLMVLAAVGLSAQQASPISYDTIYTHEFSEPNETLVAEFAGEKGNLIYVEGEFAGLGSVDVEIDLRDPSGRSIGFREKYQFFDPFILAELPRDGRYSVAVTAEDAGPVKYIVARTSYLGEGVTTDIEGDRFQRIFGVRAERDGLYELRLKRDSGDLASDFSIVNYSHERTPAIVRMTGTQLDTARARFHLESGNDYVAFLDEARVFEPHASATVTLELARVEDGREE